MKLREILIFAGKCNCLEKKMYPMKLIMLGAIGSLFLFNSVSAQTGKGSIKIEYTTERKTFDDLSKTKVISATTERKSYETDFVSLLLRKKKDLDWIIQTPKQSSHFEERVITAVNHTSMPSDGVTWGKNLDTHPIRMKYHTETKTIDPCMGEGLMVESVYDFEGPISDKILDVVLAVAGDRSAIRIHAQSRGGSFAKKYTASRQFTEADHSSGDCRHKTQTSDMKFADEWVHPPVTSERYNTSEDGAISIAEPAEISFEEFAHYLDEPTKVRTFTAPFRKVYEYGTDYSETKGLITLTLGSAPTGDLVLSMDGDYDSWLPVLDQDLKPTKLTVKARVESKDPKPTRMRLTLGDATRYKGVATNYPVDGVSSLDIYFPKDQPAGLEWVDSVTLNTKDKVKEVAANVVISDYAASAKFYAAAIDESYGSKEQYGDLPYLQLPKDRDANSIADGWQEKVGVSKKSATWDNDQFPVGQKRQGDGYTLFEEYRGFIVERNAEYDASGSVISGKHIRTNPDHKDFFFYDKDGLVREYVEPHSPFKLNVHYVVPGMLRYIGEARNPKDRVVNTNTPKGLAYAPQYALAVVSWTRMVGNDGSQEYGEAMSVGGSKAIADKFAAEMNGDQSAKKGFTYLWTVKDFYFVKVSPASVSMWSEKARDKAAAFKKYMESTVIHEIGHGLGIRHHPRSDGKEDDDSRMSGVLTCAMRYSSPTEDEHPDVLVAQQRFCTADETYPHQPDPNKLDTISKKAHNCFGQIDVKSDP